MKQRTWFWEIRLLGEPRDVAHLATCLVHAGFVLRQDSDGWWLRSTRADAHEDARDAYEAVRIELAEVSGVLKLTIGSTTPLKPGGVMRVNADGRRDFFLVTTGGIRLHGQLSNDGGASLRQLAERDPAVAKALRLLVTEDSEYWTGIYRLVELIEVDVGGKAQLLALGSASDAEYRRFKHSSNSVAVGGDLARHGAEQHDPPKNPMSLPEAQSFANSLLERWLSSKP